MILGQLTMGARQAKNAPLAGTVWGIPLNGMSNGNRIGVG